MALRPKNIVDPRLWRPIADENAIDDPYSIAAGNGVAHSNFNAAVCHWKVLTMVPSVGALIPSFRTCVSESMEQSCPLEAKADIIAISVLEDVNATGMFTFTLLLLGRGGNARQMD